jgi:tRNA modification GTPase
MKWRDAKNPSRLNVGASLNTIAAIATAPGRGGVGVIRVSGPATAQIADLMVKKTLSPRLASYANFYAADDQVLDQGLALFFPGPHSFTGEDVLELQGHGGAIVMQQVLQAVLDAGATLAAPGEFSQRAFLNHKIDLAQAEAIADLIDAQSQQAARAAMQSLQGVFSSKIHDFLNELIELRKFVEAAIDFVDEDIEFIQAGKIEQSLLSLIEQLEQITAAAQQGVLLQAGMTVVLAGKPNAGKSSLLNALAGQDRAIVTDIAGTTRDTLQSKIQLQGMPVHIIDTAGLRETADRIEQEGVRRAHAAMQTADAILMVVDASCQSPDQVEALHGELRDQLGSAVPLITVYNKQDLLDAAAQPQLDADSVLLSAKHGSGIAQLQQRLIDLMGLRSGENVFIARQRHLTALEQAANYIKQGLQQLHQQQASELLADDLYQAQQQLNSITGEFSSDDLLSEIFSSFCIGK